MPREDRPGHLDAVKRGDVLVDEDEVEVRSADELDRGLAIFDRADDSMAQALELRGQTRGNEILFPSNENS